MRNLLLLIAAALISISCSAQWQTHGPYGGTINSIVTNGNNIFVATDAGVFLSSDTGANWKPVNNGISEPQVQILARCGTYIFASTGDSLFLSSDNGAHWNLANIPLQDYVFIGSIATQDSIVIVGFSEGIVYISKDGGYNWLESDSGLPLEYVTSLGFNGSTIYANTQGGFYMSIDTGRSWRSVTITGLPNGYFVYSIVSNDTGIFVSAGNGKIYLSTNNGSTWVEADSGLPTSSTYITSLTISGSNIFASADYYGIYLSTNNGRNWQRLDTKLKANRLGHVTVSGENIFIGSFDNGVFLSQDNANTWKQINNGLAAHNASAFTKLDSTIFCGVSGGIFLSNDNGNTWIESDSGLPVNSWVTGFGVSGGAIFAGLFTGAEDPASIYVSENAGASWRAAYGNLGNAVQVSNIAVSGRNIYAGFNDGILYSNDRGASWSVAAQNSMTLITSMVINGDNVFAGSYTGGVFLSTDSGASWAAMNNGLQDTYVSAIALDGANLYASNAYGIFISTDNGSNWTNTTSIFSARFLAANRHTVVASTESQGMVYSTDDGKHWTVTNAGLPSLSNSSLNGMAIIDTTIFVGIESYSAWQLPLPISNNCLAGFQLYQDTSMPHHWYALEHVSGTPPFTYSWNWGDGNVSYSDTASHTYDTAGYYNLCLTIIDSAHCTSTFCDSSDEIYKNGSSMVTVNAVTQLPVATAVAQITNEIQSFSIYPNPSTNHLLIDATGFQPEWISIYDMDGRIITYEKFTRQLDVSAIAPGMYFVELKGDNFTERRRFVKQ